MKPVLLEEKKILEAAPEFVNKFVELWHKCTKERLGTTFEVQIGNRRSHPQLGTFPGILTACLPGMLDNKIRLIVWYDPFDIVYKEKLKEQGYSDNIIQEVNAMLGDYQAIKNDYDPVKNVNKIDWDKFIRQIGFWIIRMSGFKSMRTNEQQYHEISNMINSESWIPKLYKLMEDVNYNYIEGVDRLADDAYYGLKKLKSFPSKYDLLINSLNLSNLMAFSSKEKTDKLKELIEENHPELKENIDKVNKLKASYDLLNPDQNIEYTRELIFKFKIRTDWFINDDINQFI